MAKIDHGIGYLALDWLQWGEKWDEKKAEIALRYMNQLKEENKKLAIAVEALEFYEKRDQYIPIDISPAKEALAKIRGDG